MCPLRITLKQEIVMLLYIGISRKILFNVDLSGIESVVPFTTVSNTEKRISS